MIPNGLQISDRWNSLFIFGFSDPPLWTNIKSLPWLFLRPSLYIKLQWCWLSHNLMHGAQLREEHIQAKT